MERRLHRRRRRDDRHRPVAGRGGRSLRRRLIAWLGLVMALLFTLNYAALQAVILPSFEQVENAEAEKNFDRTLNALNGEIQDLHATAGDYANWNDAYAFAAGEENGFAEANGTPVSMAHLDLIRVRRARSGWRAAARQAAPPTRR